MRPLSIAKIEIRLSRARQRLAYWQNEIDRIGNTDAKARLKAELRLENADNWVRAQTHLLNWMRRQLALYRALKADANMPDPRIEE
jgi:hypothetical protein